MSLSSYTRSITSQSITEYFPQEVADMLKGIGMEVSQVFACKKTHGGFRVHANPLRRRVISALHSIHLLGIAARLREPAYARAGRKFDSVRDYVWSETTIGNITAKNCDSFAIALEQQSGELKWREEAARLLFEGSSVLVEFSTALVEGLSTARRMGKSTVARQALGSLVRLTAVWAGNGRRNGFGLWRLFR
jgi:hypothetical protein